MQASCFQLEDTHPVMFTFVGQSGTLSKGYGRGHFESMKKELLPTPTSSITLRSKGVNVPTSQQTGVH